MKTIGFGRRGERAGPENAIDVAARRSKGLGVERTSSGLGCEPVRVSAGLQLKG